MEVLSEEGLGGMARAVELLLNEAMRLERAAFLGAAPNERTPERVGHANGFKPKALNTRLGQLGLGFASPASVRDRPDLGRLGRTRGLSPAASDERRSRRFPWGKATFGHGEPPLRDTRLQPIGPSCRSRL
jgi:hypothetical protein